MRKIILLAFVFSLNLFNVYCDCPIAQSTNEGTTLSVRVNATSNGTCQEYYLGSIFKKQVSKISDPEVD